MRVALVLLSVLLLAGCMEKPSTTEFGTESPRVLWDSQGHAWLVSHHTGNVFTVDRLPDLDRSASK